MGVATATAISLGLAATSTGVSIYQGIQGAKAEADAKAAAAAAARDAERISEIDKYLSLNVPTLGLELAQQNMQKWQQSQIQALKESGAAGVLGGLTNVNLQAQEQNQQLAAQADQMQYQRDQMQAQNAQQIEANRVARQSGLTNARLSGAQTAAAEGRNTKNQAIQNTLQGLSSAAQLYAYQDIYGDKTPKADNYTPGNYAPANTAAVQNAATAAFKPQVTAMAPSNVQINNPTLNQAQNNLGQANYMAGLRSSQGQYEASQLAGLRAGQGQFNSQYQWNPYNNQWIQNAPY